jgi:S-adenosyl methyltransferase
LSILGADAEPVKPPLPGGRDDCNGLHFVGCHRRPEKAVACNFMGNGPLVPFDAAKPSVARLHDYALGGKDNFAADREMAAELEGIFPLAGVLARENREFLARAVGYVARHGAAQFIDVGSGMPASPGIHEIAALASPDARVAYVDNDPLVISHAAALLTSPGRVAAVPGDARRPQDILASPGLTALIDTSRPFCVILATILDFFEPAQAAGIVAAFRDAMPAGSFLIVSIGINNDPGLAQEWIKAYAAARVHLHSREQIAGYFAGLELVDPGLTEVRYWRPPRPQAADDPRPADLMAGVGRMA